MSHLNCQYASYYVQPYELWTYYDVRLVSCNEPGDLSCVINIEHAFIALQFDNWIEVKLIG